MNSFRACEYCGLAEGGVSRKTMGSENMSEAVISKKFLQWTLRATKIKRNISESDLFDFKRFS